LFLSRGLGFRIVWTAHNVLPHTPVFDDDVAARQSLLRRCDAVVAMNPAVAEEVRQRFSPTCPVSIIPHGNYDGAYGLPLSKVEAREALQIPDRAFVVLFFGRIETYKGVPELLRSCEHIRPDANFLIVIVGACRDSALRTEIERLAAASPHQVRLRLEEIPSNEVPPLLSAASVIAFPFKSLSTSGSLVLAMGMRAACLVPNLPALSDVPEDAVLRYEPRDPAALEGALKTAMELGDCGLSRLSDHARAYAATLSWDNIARQHNHLFSRVARGAVKP
jgi:glycosyltransferase involved in cell wall biosynthesis